MHMNTSAKFAQFCLRPCELKMPFKLHCNIHLCHSIAFIWTTNDLDCAGSLALEEKVRYMCPGINLGMGSANQRQCYIVMLSLIGWAHTQNDPRCLWCFFQRNIWHLCHIFVWSLYIGFLEYIFVYIYHVIYNTIFMFLNSRMNEMYGSFYFFSSGDNRNLDNVDLC